MKKRIASLLLALLLLTLPLLGMTSCDEVSGDTVTLYVCAQQKAEMPDDLVGKTVEELKPYFNAEFKQAIIRSILTGKSVTASGSESVEGYGCDVIEFIK